MNTPLNRRSNIRREVAALIRRRSLWPTFVLALVLALTGCGGGDDGGDDGPGSVELDLVIGNVLPLTGLSKALGRSGEKASDLAIEQIEQATGESDSDHDVRAVQEDQGKGDDAASAAAKTLINRDGASCLTGPWSPEAVAQTADDIAIPSKVLEIAPVPANEEVVELNDRDLVDSTALPESLEGSALSKAIEGDLGGADSYTVNVAASNDSYGDTLAQDFIEAWQDKDGTVGGQVVLAPAPLSSSSSTSPSSVYAAQAQQITSGSPDAVLVIDDVNGFSVLAPALSSSFGWDPATAWGSDQLVSPGIPALAGSEAVEGMRALAPGTPKGETASSAFVQEFKSAEPRDVKQAPFAAQEFDAVVLCYLAAVAAGSADGQEMADELIDITAPGGDEFSWQRLPDAVKALEDGEDIDYVGASGPIDMDVRGNPTSGVFDVYQYVGERLEVVGEVSVEKPNPAGP
jgi:ABC-type branched-subunit amino acid transport system substrate-binding protein